MSRPPSNLSEYMTTITLRMPAEGKKSIRRAAKKHRLTQDQIIASACTFAKQKGALKIFKRRSKTSDPELNEQYQVRILIEAAISIQLAADEADMYQGQYVFACWNFSVANGFLETLVPGEKRKYLR